MTFVLGKIVCCHNYTCSLPHLIETSVLYSEWPVHSLSQCQYTPSLIQKTLDSCVSVAINYYHVLKCWTTHACTHRYLKLFDSSVAPWITWLSRLSLSLPSSPLPLSPSLTPPCPTLTVLSEWHSRSPSTASVQNGRSEIPNHRDATSLLSRR